MFIHKDRFMPLLSIVIPTLNEAEGIGKTIHAIPVSQLNKLGFETEILVVDGNSTDGTIELARNSGAKVIIENQKGYGRAYKTGFEKANGEIIVTLDADGTYPAEDIPALLGEMKEKNYDFITTNRFAKMEKDAMSSRNKLGNLVLSFTTKTLYGASFQDSQSGMWVFRKFVWNKIKDKVKSDGMAFSQELKIEAYRTHGFKCCEIGITYRKREGEVKLNAYRDGIGNLTHLFRKKFDR